jgi:hypothetical protein
MITLDGLSDRQKTCAELLWQCQTKQQVDTIVQLFGVDAIIMRELIVASTLDEIDDTEVAMLVLKEIFI